MLLQDFENKETFGYFNGWITMKQAKEEGIIPDYLYDVFKNECVCGSEVIIQRNRKRFMCCDTECFEKKAWTIEEVFSRIGAKNTGISFSREVARKLEKRYPKMPLFKQFYLGGIQPGDLSTVDYITYCDAMRLLKSKEYTFSEIISVMSIPGFNTKLNYLFRKFDTFEALEKEINKYSSFRSFCVINCITDVTVMFNLYYNLENIKYAYLFFKQNMVRAASETITIAATGSLVIDGRKLSRNEIAPYLNKIVTDETGRRIINISLVNSFTRACRYLLADSPQPGHRKYRDAMAREQETGRKMIVTGQYIADRLRMYKDLILKEENNSNDEKQEE